MENGNNILSIINVDALILCKHKKSRQKFIDYLNMKITEESNDYSINNTTNLNTEHSLFTFKCFNI